MTLFDPQMITRPFGRYAIIVNDKEVPHVSGEWDPAEATEHFNEFVSRYNIHSNGDGTHHVHIREAGTGELLADLVVDSAHHAVELVQDDHLAHLDQRGLGDAFDERTTYSTRDAAVLDEIIEPIETLQVDVADYDLAAIADRVLATHAGGYACVVDEDRFWQIVEESEISTSVAADAETEEKLEDISPDKDNTSIHLHRRGWDTGVTFGVWHDRHDGLVRDVSTTVVVSTQMIRDALRGDGKLTVELCRACVKAHDDTVRRDREESKVRAEVERRLSSERERLEAEVRAELKGGK